MKRSNRLRHLPSASMGAFGSLITCVVIAYPDHAFGASIDGLRLWFDIVLPALLPFFVLSEILMGLGVIRAVGVLLEPLMRPVFRIPGEAAFTLAMGLASGYPLGAKLTGRMRRNGICTREEGERLLAFANTADPLFMIGAVAFGMFGSASLGATIAVSHYLAALIVGFLLRYHAKGTMGASAARPDAGRGYLRRALQAMVAERRRDGRPIGALFSDAVRDAMGSMLFIGGTIMMFSVFLRILSVSGAATGLATLIGGALSTFGFDPDLGLATLNGLMEITLGAQTAAGSDADLLQRLTIAGFVIGWSGLSVHAQVAAMVHGTDIRLTPYVLARLVHGILAAGFTWFVFPRIAMTATAPGAAATYSLPYWIRLSVGGASALGLLAFMVGAALALAALRRIRIAGFRV
ncbi:MAG: sporulation integral membrane protein YlbJ [Firmicutes bacterium]|nr:sporulation integral membrane protein YlbJ [Bacillota bacterium]